MLRLLINQSRINLILSQAPWRSEGLRMVWLRRCWKMLEPDLETAETVHSVHSAGSYSEWVPEMVEMERLLFFYQWKTSKLIFDLYLFTFQSFSVDGILIIQLLLKFCFGRTLVWLWDFWRCQCVFDIPFFFFLRGKWNMKIVLSQLSSYSPSPLSQTETSSVREQSVSSGGN